MAFDGIMTAAICAQLNKCLAGGRIDKILQPERDEVNITMRSLGRNWKLLLSANASNPRVCLTDADKENPQSPPLFCMVLRKRLTGGKVISFTQPDFERVVNIKIESATEMGDMTEKTLSTEIMGKHSNIILAENGVVLDSVKRVGLDTSSVRQVLPGLPYAPPPAQNKQSPLDLREDGFNALLSEGKTTAQKAIQQGYRGISPIMAAEICFRANVEATATTLSAEETSRLFAAFNALMGDVRSGNFAPEAVFDQNGVLVEFAAVPLTMFGEGYKRRPFEDASSLAEFYYRERDAHYHALQRTQDLRKTVSSHIERLVKKTDIHQATIKEAAKRETWRLYGELLTANIYNVPKAAKTVSCVNFYDENGATVDIPLDETQTPAENAQRYFKRYNKEKRADAAANENIAKAAEELEYLESVMTAIDSAAESADLAEIREELAIQGFVKKRPDKGGGSKGKPKPKKTKPLIFTSPNGFTVLVGKSNTQNDELTLKQSEKTDLWLHAQKIPGSHVIIKANGRPIPDADTEYAAGLAAYYSKAKNSSIVAVDFCPVKQVKKPNGARPGFVIYENYRTAYVKPKEEETK